MVKEQKEIIMSWQNSLILEPNERILYGWKGDRETMQRIMEKGSSVVRKFQTDGVLVVTNQRLLFLTEHGLFGKSYHQTFSIPIERIQGISQGGSISHFVSITDDRSTHIFHIRVKFDTFRDAIMKVVVQRRQELEEERRKLEEERRKDRLQIVVDFSSLKDYMEKGGLVLQKTKCPECGASIALPDSGNQARCEHCGSSIYAQDVFEKIKTLIA